MFGFPIVALPLTFLTLRAWFFPRSEGDEMTRYFGRGLLWALPAFLLHALLYRIFPELPGSMFFIFRIWWERFFLSFGLAILAFRALHPLRQTGRGVAALRNYTAFLFGFFTLFCVVFALRATETPSVFSLIFFPVLVVAGIPTAAYLLERASDETGIYTALWVALAVAVSLVFACVAYLFEARMEWLGGIFSLAALGLGTYLGYLTLR